MELLDTYIDGNLPADFFDEVMRDMISQEKDIMFVPGAEIDTKNGPIVSNGIIVLDPLTGSLTTGRKYPVANNYEVKSDLEPSRIVLDWMIGFSEGSDAPFPHVPKATPLIPPSRYEKTSEFYDVYSYFINHGYQIYNPSFGQKTKYPGEIVYSTEIDGDYICNTYRDFKACKGNAIMLDFNPYNPLSIMSIVKIEMCDDSKIKYSRIWKDNQVDGVFRKKLKRYHYDIWGAPILGKKYYNAVKMRCFDIVVNSYTKFERIVKVGDPQNRVNPVLFDPIHVDPYFVPKGKWSKTRSNLRLAIYNEGDVNYQQVCLPWNNYKLSAARTGFNYRRVDDPNYSLGPGRPSVYLPRLHNEVKEIMKKKSALRSQDERDKVTLSKGVFIQRKFVSSYDGTVVKRDEYCSQRFVCAFVNSESGIQMEFVPYKISRYPNNHEGTLIPSIMTLTLEEFMYTWKDIYTQVKAPWWLEEFDSGGKHEFETQILDDG